MSPLARPDMGRPGALGRCSTHRRARLAEPRADLAEQIATERLAQESRAYVDGDDTAPPLPRTPRRRGTCPDCVRTLAAAAAAYLNGDNQ
ncbi:hypothetical protein FHX75_13509 [Micromonospora palomenae]|uniref:Uncharacterized protein n=1 Tax=Micromonospora palomenae TaxID=1461247 RepID=A0A561VPC2_9ACTN|nr:hypothetical protein [Micromonospora palomenae]TWG13465.1 hypothetical protein FHX75_13509 [Micromonospora palomenae]